MGAYFPGCCARILAVVVHLRRSRNLGSFFLFLVTLKNLLGSMRTVVAREPKPMSTKQAGSVWVKEVSWVECIKVAWMSLSTLFLVVHTMNQLSVRFRNELYLLSESLMRF